MTTAATRAVIAQPRPSDPPVKDGNVASGRDRQHHPDRPADHADLGQPQVGGHPGGDRRLLGGPVRRDLLGPVLRILHAASLTNLAPVPSAARLTVDTALEQAAREQVEQLLARAEAADGYLALNEAAVLALRHGRVRHGAPHGPGRRPRRRLRPAGARPADQHRIPGRRSARPAAGRRPPAGQGAGRARAHPAAAARAHRQRGRPGPRGPRRPGGRAHVADHEARPGASPCPSRRCRPA